VQAFFFWKRELDAKTEEVALVGPRLNFKKSSVLLAGGRFGLVEGVVGRADQGASFYVLEAHLFAQNFVL
jgi:hypothetical protein